MPENETPFPDALPDPYAQAGSVPSLDNAPHDGPAFRSLLAAQDAAAVATLQGVLDSLLATQEKTALVPGHQATGLLLSALNALIAEAQRHLEHLQRVIVP